MALGMSFRFAEENFLRRISELEHLSALKGSFCFKSRMPKAGFGWFALAAG
jgi:hypothetical protein